MDDGRRGGLAVIYCDSLQVTRISVKMTTIIFEDFIVKVVLGIERFLLVNIYRSQDAEIIAFLNELMDTLVSSGGPPHSYW